jgi:CheY-like chemotaxis protein
METTTSPISKQKTALVVDDSKLARYVLKEMLIDLSIKVETAESAEEALGSLSAFRPDVIFMDHMMPGMDGFQAVQAIKNL